MPFDRFNVPATLTMLRPRHHLVIDRLIHGLPRKHAAFPDIEPHTPLLPKQIAAVLGVRLRYVNRLLQEPIVLAEVTKQIGELRNGARAKAVGRMIGLIDHTNGRTALAAAKAVLGEDSASINVNVQTNVGVQVRPGYVIRQPAPRTAPVTIDQSGKTIDE